MKMFNDVFEPTASNFGFNLSSVYQNYSCGFNLHQKLEIVFITSMQIQCLGDF